MRVFLLSIFIFLPSVFSAEISYKEMFKKRTPYNFHKEGYDQNGGKCLVIYDIYQNKMREKIPGTPATMDVQIYFRDLNKSSFYGSWITSGGRGGCMETRSNEEGLLWVYQTTGPGAPCFAHPQRVFHYKGHLKLSHVNNKKDLEVSVKKDGDIYFSSCTIPNAGTFLK